MLYDHQKTGGTREIGDEYRFRLPSETVNADREPGWFWREAHTLSRLPVHENGVGCSKPNRFRSVSGSGRIAVHHLTATPCPANSLTRQLKEPAGATPQPAKR